MAERDAALGERVRELDRWIRDQLVGAAVEGPYPEWKTENRCWRITLSGKRTRLCVTEKALMGSVDEIVDEIKDRLLKACWVDELFLAGEEGLVLLASGKLLPRWKRIRDDTGVSWRVFEDTVHKDIVFVEEDGRKECRRRLPPGRTLRDIRRNQLLSQLEKLRAEKGDLGKGATGE